MKILIIGCGPTGLGAACKIWEYLKTHSEDEEKLRVKVVDRESLPGGLSTTVYDKEGFGWDCGVHITFSTFGFYNEILDKAVNNWKVHKRDVMIDLTSLFGKDARYPYPIQKSVPYFPNEARLKCIEDIRQLWKEKEEKEKAGEDGPSEVGTFENFCHLSFGKTLCEIFFKPYNEKIWTTPLDKLSDEWISARVAPIDLKDVEKDPEEAKSKEDHGWGPNAVFRYPDHGGAGFIWESVTKLLPFDWFGYNEELTKVDLKNKTATLKNMKSGTVEEHKYDYLISSIPIDILAQLCINPNLNLNLRHTSVLIVGVAVEDKLPECLVGKTWFYFPDDSPFYRITVVSNYFNNCTPDNNRFYSLLCEISMDPLENEEKLDTENFNRKSVARLVEKGFIREKEKVHHVHSFLLPYGYPIPTMQRNKELRKAHTILEENGVFSRGRFGGWKYEASNQDFSFMQGAEAAEKILQGTTEVVYNWK